jgi:hypothetical protein
MASQAEVRFKWSFGATATAEGGAVLGSTGSGTRASVLGLGRDHTFVVETDAGCTCSYQICAARTVSGASLVLSSGTLSTAAMDLIQVDGPLGFVFPRIKTMTSTSVNVTVELLAN